MHEALVVKKAKETKVSSEVKLSDWWSQQEMNKHTYDIVYLFIFMYYTKQISFGRLLPLTCKSDQIWQWHGHTLSFVFQSKL